MHERLVSTGNDVSYLQALSRRTEGEMEQMPTGNFCPKQYSLSVSYLEEVRDLSFHKSLSLPLCPS